MPSRGTRRKGRSRECEPQDITGLPTGSARTTKLSDRRDDKFTLDEVEQITI
jgi:hypothetical protein